MSPRGWLLFALMCVIWGIPYLLIRLAVRDLSPAVLVFARTGVAAVLLVPIALARGELSSAFHRLAPLVAFAVVEIAVPWFMLARAETRVASSLAGLLIAAVPLVGVFLARITKTGERFGAASLAGLVLGVVGVVALVGFDLAGASALSLAEIAVVVIGYALGPAILATRLDGVPPLGVIAASLAIAALLYAPAAAFSHPHRVPSFEALASVATLSVVCTAVAFVLFFALIGEIGPVRATVVTYVNPAIAVALGVGLLGERLTPGMAVGFALILAGSVLATRPHGRSRRRLTLAAGETP